MHIGKREIFKSIVLLLVYSLLFVFFNDNIVFADTYNCLPGTYCYDTGPGNLEISIPYYSCSSGTCVNSSNAWMTGCTWNGGSSCTQSAAPVSGYYSYSACVNDLKDVCVSWNTICKQSTACNPRTGFCYSPISNRECSTSADCCYSWGQGSCKSYDTECGGGTSIIEAGTCCRPGEPPPPPCTPITSCPDSTCTNLGYSASQTSYGTIIKKCSDTCGDELNKTCYCYQCSVDPCPTKYNVSNQGYGSLVYDSCTNDCGNVNSRTCYCSNCLKACPDPLTPTGSASLILESFRECTNDCNIKPAENQDDCYEVFSTQPTETFSIVDPGNIINPLNGYDFKSLTQTGIYGSDSTRKKDLNDPTRPLEMTATYTDTDGAGDIEGMFVWFRHESISGPYGTPVHLSNSSTDSPQSSDTNNWGFMLRRVGNGWNAYVPSFEPTPSVWVEAADLTIIDGEYAKFDIAGPNQVKMVEVTILDTPSVNGNSITFKFSLRFTNSGTSFGSKASEGKYKILLMGLDKFSFTPYDNYSIDYGGFWEDNYLLKDYSDFSYYWKNNQLRYNASQSYASDWTEATTSLGIPITWTLDFTNPRIVSFVKEIQDNKIIISWQVDNRGDSRNLYAVVGNVYSSIQSDLDRKPIDIDVLEQSHTISLINNDGNFTPPWSNGSNDVVGKLNSGWSFKVEPNNLNSTTNSGKVSIDIKDNTMGIIYIHLHVFDYAGNYESPTALNENLADRLLTSGGLAYSYGGTTFAQLTPTDDSLWSGILPPYANPTEGLLRKNAGHTSEMLSRYSSTLDVLANASIGSYSISNYRNDSISNSDPFYDSMIKAYELHKEYLGASLQRIDLSSTLSDNLSTLCTTSYCAFFRDGDLGVNNLTCNKNAVIFVSGSLSVTPPIVSVNSTTISNTNGCIFVVGGNVTINPGTNDVGTFEYEKINAFIVSDGVITLNHQSQAIVDGVYINGGLISKGEANSIVIRRYLRLEERLVYPVLAIDLHPKYGILAEKFFGNSYVIQSTEVGLKPY